MLYEVITGALKRCEGILSQAMSEALRGNFFELQLELALLQVLLSYNFV